MITLAAKPVLESIKARLTFDIKQFKDKYNRSPRLAVILVGEDPGSQVYVAQKGKTAVELGMEHETLKFPANATVEEVKAAIDRLNADPKVDGILVQRPLPKHFKEDETLFWVSPEKDVDAFHPVNVGGLVLGLPAFAPCTPAGVMELLAYYKIPVAGKVACVIGRSAIVGKPMASLLLQADATVFQCHSKTPDLAKVSSQADIVVVAVGRRGMVDSSFIREGATVIDVGINRGADGKITGDIIFDEVARKAGAVTPVPGGVGPMTIAMLMKNTLKAAQNRLDRPTPA